MKPLHPQSIKAANLIYDSYKNGKDVRWVEIINDAVLKSKNVFNWNKVAKKVSPLETILNQVAEYFHIDYWMVRSTYTNADLIFPRHVAMLLMYEAGIRLCVIDRFFGRTDGCAGHGKQNALKLIECYPKKEGKQYRELRKLVDSQ